MSDIQGCLLGRINVRLNAAPFPIVVGNRVDGAANRDENFKMGMQTVGRTGMRAARSRFADQRSPVFHDSMGFWSQHRDYRLDICSDNDSFAFVLGVLYDNNKTTG